MSDLNRRLTRIETRLAEPTPAAFDLDELYTPERLAEIAATLDPLLFEAVSFGSSGVSACPASNLLTTLLTAEARSAEWLEARNRLWSLTQGDLSWLDKPHWDPAELINTARVYWLGIAGYYRWLEEGCPAQHPMS